MIKALRHKAMRRAISSAPNLPGPLGIAQLKGLQLARYYAGSPTEAIHIDKRAASLRERLGEKVSQDLQPVETISQPHVSTPSAPKDLDSFLTVLRDGTLTEQERAAKFESMTDVEFQNVAAKVVAPFHELFTVDTAAFGPIFERYSRTLDPKLFLPLLELAPDLGAAFQVLNLQSEILSRGRKPFSLDDLQSGQSHTSLDLIIVDNQIDLSIAEVLCRRFCPDAVVRFSNRVTITGPFQRKRSEVIKSWRPLIEGNVAYYTKAEEELDSEFITWMKSVLPTFDKLFDEKRGSGAPLRVFGQAGRDIVRFLFEDLAYLRFREHFAWRKAIELHGGPPSKSNILLMSKRGDLMASLELQGCLNGCAHVAIWGLNPPRSATTQRKDRRNVIRAATPPGRRDAAEHNYRNMTRAQLSRHFEINVAKNPVTRPYVIMTTSAFPSYIEYAMRLVSELGADNCIIFDLNPFGINKGAHAKAVSLNVAYRAASYMTQYKNISRWEQDLVDMMFDVFQSHLQQRNSGPKDIISSLLADATFLHTNCVYVLRAIEQLWFMSDYCDRAIDFIAKSDKHTGKPIIFMMPGRMPIPYTLASHRKDVKTVDVQFFMNSISFRYKKPQASLSTVIDTIDHEQFLAKFKMPKSRVLNLGSPSIDAFLKGRLVLRRLDYSTLTGPMAERRILFVGQPNSFETWYPALDAIRELVQTDSRIRVDIKLHPQNSNGSMEVFKARLGERNLRNITFHRDGDIYDLILRADVAIGWSSNSLIETAALGKAVFLIDEPFVRKYLVPRSIGKLVSAQKLSSTVLEYFDSPAKQRAMSKNQAAYFEANKGMDPRNSDYDFTRALLEAAVDERSTDAAARKRQVTSKVASTVRKRAGAKK